MWCWTDLQPLTFCSLIAMWTLTKCGRTVDGQPATSKWKTVLQRQSFHIQIFACARAGCDRCFYTSWQVSGGVNIERRRQWAPDVFQRQRQRHGEKKSMGAIPTSHHRADVFPGPGHRQSYRLTTHDIVIVCRIWSYITEDNVRQCKQQSNRICIIISRPDRRADVLPSYYSWHCHFVCCNLSQAWEKVGF